MSCRGGGGDPSLVLLIGADEDAEEHSGQKFGDPQPKRSRLFAVSWRLLRRGFVGLVLRCVGVSVMYAVWVWECVNNILICVCLPASAIRVFPRAAVVYCWAVQRVGRSACKPVGRGRKLRMCECVSSGFALPRRAGLAGQHSRLSMWESAFVLCATAM